MESLVLCPEELCLGPVRVDSPSGGVSPSTIGISPPPADLTIWSGESVEKGARFLPWKGTVRSDRLPVFDKLPEFDIRHRYGLYDEISEVSPSRKIRQCNWIRFLRYSLVYSDAVNVVGTKSPTGEPVFELIKDIGPKTELIAFFVPERPEETFLLPAIQYLRHTLFKRLIDNVLEESPLDLSTSLVSKVFPAGANPLVNGQQNANSPPPREGTSGRKSVGSGSDCTTTSINETEGNVHSGLSLASPLNINGANNNNNNNQATLHALNAAAAAAHASSVLFSKSFLAPPSLFPPQITIPPTHTQRPKSPPHILSVESLTSKVSSAAAAAVAASPITTPSVTSFPSPPMTSSSPFSFLTTASPSEKSLPSSPSPSSPLSQAPTTPPRAPVVRRREKNMLPCNYCGKAFDRPSLLKRHIRIHTGERPHVCDICSKGFSTSSSLNTHRRIHSGEKPHQCGVCGKRFTASSNLYYHKMTHVKEKPHKCTMCSKSFPTPGDLKSHTYVHTGTWPFKCHICHRGFSKQTNLKNHLLLHSGDKPFNCDICHKKFALSCNLRAHLKTHEAEYQNSAASLALYQRALAVLGSQAAMASASKATNGPDAEADAEEEEEEDVDLEEPVSEEGASLRSSPSAQNGDGAGRSPSSSSGERIEFSKQLTVAV